MNIKFDPLYNLETLEIFKKRKEKYFNDTVKYQKLHGFDMGTGEHATWNNEADAFKHAYMSAILSIRYDEITSVSAGYWHEIKNLLDRNKKSETNMDLHNNYEGYKIAKEIKKDINYQSFDKYGKQVEDLVAKKVIEKMNRGQLILNPTDQRAKTIKNKIEDYIKLRISSQKTLNKDSDGHWVTINGNHVKLK